MPVKVEKRGNKFRVVESKTGKIAKNKGGTAADGGGFSDKSKAIAQVNAINLSDLRRQGRKVARRK